MNHVSTLDHILLEIAACKRCPLYRTRTMTVPGEGPENAPVAFIGEGPGEAEDRSGRPFVGPAGQLLNRLLLEVGIPREKVWIGNAVCCRAHEDGRDRPPERGEIDACRDRLIRQLRAIDPRIVVLLGSTAVRSVLLVNDFSIQRLRQRVRRAGGRWVIVTYHPSAELHARTGKIREMILEDLWLLRDVIDVEWGTREWPWSEHALAALSDDSDIHLPSTDGSRLVWNLAGVRRQFTSTDVIRELLGRFVRSAVDPDLVPAGVWSSGEVVETSLVRISRCQVLQDS